MRGLLIAVLLVGFSSLCWSQALTLTDDQVASMSPSEALMFASFLNQQFPPTDNWRSNGAGADFFNNRYRRLVPQVLVVRGITMTEMDFRGIFFHDLYFQYCNLERTDFSGCYFWDGHFLVCNLDRTKWRRAFLGNAKFFGVSEMEADFNYPLGNTIMRGASLDLSGSYGLISFDSVDLTNTKLVKPVVDPSNLGEAAFVFANCNMEGFAVSDTGDAKSLVFRRCINLDRGLYDRSDGAIRKENGLPPYPEEADGVIDELLGIIALLQQFISTF